MPTITVNIESGDTPASVTLVALFDIATGNVPAGVTLPAMFIGSGPWSFGFAGTSKYAFTYSLNYSDGPSSTESGNIAGDAALPNNITTIEGAIVAVLQADSGVAAIAGTRIHAMNDPRSLALPKITFTRWGTDRSVARGAFTNDGPNGMAQAKLFIDAWTDDVLGGRKLASAIRNALNGYSGVVGGFSIAQAYINDERDTSAADQLVPGTSKPVQRVTLDVRVTYLDV